MSAMLMVGANSEGTNSEEPFLFREKQMPRAEPPPRGYVHSLLPPNAPKSSQSALGRFTSRGDRQDGRAVYGTKENRQSIHRRSFEDPLLFEYQVVPVLRFNLIKMASPRSSR